MTRLPVRHAPSVPASQSPTIATVDLDALAHNLAQVRKYVGAACDIIAVVKADAYGHGAVAIARSLLTLGVSRLGVATLAEGRALREGGISAPILVMGALFPQECAEAIAHELTPVIYDRRQLDGFVQALSSRREPHPVHIKVDTGMGRLGLEPGEVLELVRSSSFGTAVKMEGLMTHLADADGEDVGFTRLQLERFRSLVEKLEAAGLKVPLVHAANSAAIVRHPSSHFNAVRPGIMLYGYHTLAGSGTDLYLKPVLRLSTTVAQVREVPQGGTVSYSRTYVAPRPSQIAVLPVGYADGYNRHLSNRGAVLVHGCRAPIVGRVCMDMTMVDVTEIPAVKQGDEAVLIGRQGEREITAGDLAELLDTIPYEVLCAIGPRVPRICRPPA